MKKEAILYQKLPNGKIMCTACAHYCQLKDGEYGKCGIRKAENGKLFLMVYGKALGSHIDPIEKKPLFHFLPGKPVFSWGTAGCNFYCLYCQNWSMSQFKFNLIEKNKESLAKYLNQSNIDAEKILIETGENLMPQDIVNICLEKNIPIIAATYNEPTVFFEYAFDTFKLAKKHGIKTVFVSNGYESPILRKKLLFEGEKLLDAINIDLKGFSQNFYQKLTGGNLEVVKKNIEFIATKTDVWLEVTTLLIPGRNTDEKQLKEAAKWLASINPNIPWHLTAFHPDYMMQNIPPTSPEQLLKAYQIAKEAGMKFVYVGNVYLPGYEDTYCPKCGEKLIERQGFLSTQLWQTPGICHKCGEEIPGIRN